MIQLTQGLDVPGFRILEQVKDPSLTIRKCTLITLMI